MKKTSDNGKTSDGRLEVVVNEAKRQEGDPDTEVMRVATYLELSPRAAAALLSGVAAGAGWPQIITVIVEEWARGRMGRVVRPPP
jgi:hypothetical protein